MKRLIPADTVDVKGNVWETVGENIRYGAKEFSIENIQSIVDILFPVGSVYCGENSLVLSVGTWEPRSISGVPIISSSTTQSGESTPSNYISEQENSVLGVVIRIWKRVS